MVVLRRKFASCCVTSGLSLRALSQSSVEIEGFVLGAGEIVQLLRVFGTFKSGGSQLPVTPVPGEPVLSLVSGGIRHTHIDIHRDTQAKTHTVTCKKNFKGTSWTASVFDRASKTLEREAVGMADVSSGDSDRSYPRMLKPHGGRTAKLSVH